MRIDVTLRGNRRSMAFVLLNFERPFEMAELVQQLNRAAAQVNASLSSRNQFHQPVERIAAIADEGGSNPSMLVAVGIILGCVFCGALLFLLATDSRKSQPSVQRSSAQWSPNSTSNAHTDDKMSTLRNSVGSNHNVAGRAHAQRVSKSGGRKSDASRYCAGAYVVTEPGRTPKMLESQ